jgi:hypothetical protein
MSRHQANEPKSFADLADRRPPTFLQEVWHLLVTHRSWVLVPIIAAILILGVLVMLSGTGAAPFIYTLF